jgi:ATP-dependent Clp protease ATP-binding subunit ClpC
MADARPGSGDPGGLPFTAAARRLLAGAQGEAAGLRHEYVGTEHVLLALARDAAAAALLARLGVDPAAVRATLLSAVRPGAAALPPEAERPYTSRTQRTFALAADCARTLGQVSVGVEHLLIGVAREETGIGAQVLQHHGLTADRVAAAAQGRGAAGGT